MSDGLRVAIGGGGVGGLALAHGLRRAGIGVTVYERDPGPAVRRQGYRIHISPPGAAALRSCLPPELYELFLATRGQPGMRVTVLSSRLRVLREFPPAPAPGADGDPAEADVLVGADGINSAVRRQLLPQAEAADTGTRVIYGKAPYDGRVRDALPEAVRHGFTAVTSRVRPLGMALGLMEFTESPAAAAARLCPGITVHDCGSYVMWALSASARTFPPNVTGLDGERLTAIAARLTRYWHRSLRTLVDGADPGETFALAVRTARPPPPWPGRRVTVLGDAIHAMSPAGGSGANTALRDAELLAAELAARPDDPVGAIARYEPEMRDYGFAAVLASQQANARYRR